jgi:hypothetical protein
MIKDSINIKLIIQYIDLNIYLIIHEIEIYFK